MENLSQLSTSQNLETYLIFSWKRIVLSSSEPTTYKKEIYRKDQAELKDK